PQPAESVEGGDAGFGWREIEDEKDQPPLDQPDTKTLASTEESVNEASTSPNKRTFLQALAISGFLVLLIGGIVLTISQPELMAVIAAVIVGVLVAAVVIGGIIGLILFISGTNSACPACKKWWAEDYLGRRMIEQKKCYGLVTRSAHSY